MMWGDLSVKATVLFISRCLISINVATAVGQRRNCSGWRCSVVAA